MDKAQQHHRMREAVRIFRQAGCTFRIGEKDGNRTFYCYVCKDDGEIDDITEICPKCEFDHKKVSATMQSKDAPKAVQPAGLPVNEIVGKLLGGISQQQGSTDRKLAIYLSIGVFASFTVMAFVLGVFVGFFIMK